MSEIAFLAITHNWDEYISRCAIQQEEQEFYRPGWIRTMR